MHSHSLLPPCMSSSCPSVWAHKRGMRLERPVLFLCQPNFLMADSSTQSQATIRHTAMEACNTLIIVEEMEDCKLDPTKVKRVSACDKVVDLRSPLLETPVVIQSNKP